MFYFFILWLYSGLSNIKNNKINYKMDFSESKIYFYTLVSLIQHIWVWHPLEYIIIITKLFIKCLGN